MGQWWYANIVEPEKLPLLLCLAAFVLTFVLTRVKPAGSPWFEIAAVTIGIGMSLILDEFALILHLQDVYWSNEGRVSVEMIGLTAACLGLLMLGFSPFGVDDVSVGEFSARLTVLGGLILHAALILICVLKGKYRAALISVFAPFVAWVCAIRLGRPDSWWARHRYDGNRLARASARAEKFDERWDPKWRWLGDLIAGKPSEPDPPGPTHDGHHPGAHEATPISGRRIHRNHRAGTARVVTELQVRSGGCGAAPCPDSSAWHHGRR